MHPGGGCSAIRARQGARDFELLQLHLLLLQELRALVEQVVEELVCILQVLSALGAGSQQVSMWRTKARQVWFESVDTFGLWFLT